MIYLDYNATTPPHPDLINQMFFSGNLYWSNPDSCHGIGRCSRNALELARIQCARFLGCEFEQVIFTSGGTESNNLAIRGALSVIGSCHVITTAFEHSSVENTFQAFEGKNFPITRIKPESSGRISTESFCEAIQSDTRFASVMLANNEIGTIQPVKEIAEICRSKGIILHTDAVQAVGKKSISFEDIGCDILTFSGHKFYGPRGIGGMVLREPSLLNPQITGGHQEFGVRAGTTNVPAIAALGWVCSWLEKELDKHINDFTVKRNRIEKAFLKLDPKGRVIGSETPRLGNTTFFVPSETEGSIIVEELDRRGFCVSSSAACDSGKSRITELLTGGSSGVRISLGCFTTDKEISEFCKEIENIYKFL
jgi:cysteine desulfurase